MTISLYDLFNQFCESTSDRMKWKESRMTRTRFVMAFFREYMSRNGLNEPYKDYMLVDAVWRDPRSGYIEVALEHENKGDAEKFVKEEIDHLADLKSVNKVAITYPPIGEEKRTLEAIGNVIQKRFFVTSQMPGENYLIIFGFATSQLKKRAIRWNGHFFSSEGKLRDSREKVVFQKS